MWTASHSSNLRCLVIAVNEKRHFVWRGYRDFNPWVFVIYLHFQITCWEFSFCHSGDVDYITGSLECHWIYISVFLFLFHGFILLCFCQSSSIFLFWLSHLIILSERMKIQTSSVLWDLPYKVPKSHTWKQRFQRNLTSLCVSCLQGTWLIPYTKWLRKAQQRNCLSVFPFLLSRTLPSWPHILLWLFFLGDLCLLDSFPLHSKGDHRLDEVLPIKIGMWGEGMFRELWSQERSLAPKGLLFAGVTAHKRTKPKRKTPTLYG